ncbi:MAG: MFS transporter [Candidatus Aquicultor sp.]
MRDTVDEITTGGYGVPADRGIHYGVWVLIAAVLTNLGAIGLGRFAIGMIIPKMGAGLGLTNTQLGIIVSGMFIGYLLTTVISGALATRIGPRKVIATSMCMVSVGMVIAGTASGFWAALIGQLLTGIGAGGSNVPTLGLITRWYSQKIRGTATGIVLVGSGLGFALSGILVPYIIDAYGASGWRASWFYLSCIVFVITVLGALIFRNSPSEVGLKPIGGNVSSEGSGELQRDDDGAHGHWKDVYRSRPLWELGFIYLMFGFSYVGFTTFFAKYLVEEIGFTHGSAGELWFIVGLISLVSGFLWGILSDKIGRRITLIIVYALQGLCLASLGATHNPTVIIIASIVYATTLWSIPSIMSAACADYVGGPLAPAAIGMVTIFFGIGQVLSPSLSGYVKDLTHSFAIPFLISAAANATGALLSLMLPNRDDHPNN